MSTFMKENIAPEEDMSGEAEYDLMALYEEGVFEDEEVEVPIPQYPLPASSINPITISSGTAEDDSIQRQEGESPSSSADRGNQRLLQRPLI